MKTKTIRVITDPGHGWAAVPRAELAKLNILGKISHYSYQKGELVFLEEDCDMSIYVRALMAETGMTRDSITFKEIFQENTPVRNYPSFQATVVEKLLGEAA